MGPGKEAILGTHVQMHRNATSENREREKTTWEKPSPKKR